MSATCICGSDLWPYRGLNAATGPAPMGHEYCGIVEDVGRAVTSIKPGPGVVQYTTDVLFRDLWRRPDLAPRDRSLGTVSGLIATGQSAQLPYHLNRAMDYGLTQPQAAEVLTHLAFYTGWPSVFSALPVAKDGFEKRPR